MVRMHLLLLVTMKLEALLRRKAPLCTSCQLTIVVVVALGQKVVAVMLTRYLVSCALCLFSIQRVVIARSLTHNLDKLIISTV